MQFAVSNSLNDNSSHQIAALILDMRELTQQIDCFLTSFSLASWSNNVTREHSIATESTAQISPRPAKQDEQE
jgi:hypothetical protein